MTETKPFYKTSEFWMTVITHSLTLLAELTNYMPVDFGLPVHAIVTGLYAIARGAAKSGVSPEPPITVVQPVVPAQVIATSPPTSVIHP